MDETDRTTDERIETPEKRGIFSAFSLFSGENAKGKKVPLLLLLCGAVGLLLLFAGGDFSIGKSDRQTDGGKTEEIKAGLVSLLSGVEGVGKVEIYLAADEDGTLRGIAVLCEGGEDPAVQKRLLGLLTSLYGIGSHRIFVGGLDRQAAFAGSGGETAQISRQDGPQSGGGRSPTFSSRKA